MITVFVSGANQALELKYSVLAAGVAEKEFTWTYQPPVLDEFGSWGHNRPRVTFEFDNAELETFFRLKWQCDET